MIYDNETYLRGQTSLEVRNRLWEHVITGLDGLTVFSWSKRGWIWWKTRDKVRLEADKFPYCNLNPFAKTTDSLRGILDFSLEVQPIADRILRKPWGPAPRIALLYDWAQARRAAFERRLWDKTAHYHAALKYAHWNFALLPSDRAMAGGLNDYDVLVIGGGHPHRARNAAGAGSVRGGRGDSRGRGRAVFAGHLWRPLATEGLLGVEVGATTIQGDETVEIPPALAPAALPGEVRLTAGRKTVVPRDGVEALIRSDAGAAIITRKHHGKGHVYFQAADVVGYPLCGLLWAILRDAAACGGHEQMPDAWRLAEIRDAATRELATNVLLSRRSHEKDHALLLMKLDRYDQTVDVRLPGLDASYSVQNGLTGASLKDRDGQSRWSAQRIADEGMRIEMPAGQPVFLLIEKIE